MNRRRSAGSACDPDDAGILGEAIRFGRQQAETCAFRGLVPLTLIFPMMTAGSVTVRLHGGP